MRKFWQKAIALSVALLLLAGGLVPSATAYAYTASAGDNEGMELVAQTDKASLYLDKKFARLRLVDSKSGVCVDTKIVDGDSGNTNIKANQKSDLIVSFWANDKTQGTTTQVNFTMAIDKDQVEYTPIDNGIRITYTLKEDKLNMDVVPKYISEERMQDLVMQYLSKEDKEFLDENYRLFQGTYTRQADGAGKTQTAMRRLRDIFFTKGQYTLEDMEADNAAYGYESSYSNLEIVASLEYVLDGGDLLVRMPLKDLTLNNDTTIMNSVSLLPYFLSANSQEEGYFIIPDGSGATIDFNNTLTNAIDYSSRVYGKDTLINSTEFPSADYYPNMPVLGAVYDDYAILSIVESGESLAEINAQVAGKVDNYNNAYFRFYLTEVENVATTQGSTINVNRFTGDKFDGDIVIRYKLLTDKDQVNYVGVAHAYQDYLVDKGLLKRQTIEPSLYLELLGSSLEAKSFLGFPYNGVKSLTTFEEATTIIKNLKTLGIDNAVIQMNGWLDGGERHENLTKVGLESSQGSRQDFAKMLEAASSLGYGVYPDVDMQKLYPSFDFMQTKSAKNYAKKYGSRFLSNEYVRLPEQQYAGLLEKKVLRWSPYSLSPANLESYTQKALKNLSKFHITGLTVNDLGNTLVADYSTKTPVGRENTIKAVNKSLNLITQQGLDVVLKTPYQYAWAGVSKMSDLPTRSTEFTIFNHEIPFLQLVLDGCVSYSTEPLNNKTQKDMEELLLTCIETRSNPKFYMMASEMDDLHYMLYADYMSINFYTWSERIGNLYEEYKAFADQVSGSRISSHERLSDNVVKVGYDNGVTVYLNYGSSSTTVDGQQIAAKGYLIVK